MKLKFDFLIQGLDGKDIPNASSGEILGSRLSQINDKGRSIKLFDWALKFYRKEEVELDATDLEVLKTLIDNDDQLPIITKGQLLKYIQSVK